RREGHMGTVPTKFDRDLTHAETVYPPQYSQRQLHDSKVTTEVITSGSSLELLGGLTAVVVAIIGLSYLPFYMAGVATIAIGVALLAQGASIAARWNAALRELQTNTRFERTELVGGVGTEIVAGVTGIVLGVLSLAHVMPFVLM